MGAEKDIDTPFHEIISLPAGFHSMQTVTCSDMISNIVNSSGYTFIVYLGSMTKEVRTFCGLEKFRGKLLDFTTID
jgi:hypothetical protein